MPLVEANCNMIELGPRETGKTYLYRNSRYYAHVLSGGKATPASLFINLNTGQVGAGRQPRRGGLRRDRQHRLHRSQGPGLDHAGLHAGRQVQPGQEGDPGLRLHRPGGQPGRAGRSCRTRSTTTCSSRCPSFLQVEALIDRLHYYLPGWEIPKIGPTRASQDYGFITDYFCEIMHELRRMDVLGRVKSRFELFDASGPSQGLTARDVRGVA